MGIGVSLALVAIGAVLAFATRFSISGLDIRMVGWILILVGVANMLFTLLYVRPRRRAAVSEVVEEPVYQQVAEDESEPDVVVRRRDNRRLAGRRTYDRPRRGLSR